ncbi:MAG TPA: glycerol-3-phosphate dehydrogenase/oxidase [Microbacteriaceae bacterium]|nr:glycerol-3-phosphate dehydrogenase/oxidase [Microbacteriaceae bacterium]
MARAERPSVARLRARPRADVLIIGGGINGIATAWDLALQGVDVALVERNDFVSGASAASSHMVHGGIRYLENGEFRLVHEAVVERNALLKTAPHLVRPLPTTIPIFSTFSGIIAAPFRRLINHGAAAPRERGALLIKIGLAIYDTFSRAGGTVPRHRFRNRWEARSAFPQLNRSVRYTATYFDASMRDPERLALDVLTDAQAAGARSANYVSAVAAGPDGIRLRDERDGGEFDFQARLVINATGPWTDLTNAALGTPSQFMGGTKGSHIVVKHPELLQATHGNEIFFEHSDGRIVLIYPLNGRVIIGTTDIEADPREPAVCTEQEIAYFFDLVKHVFPNITLRRDDIVFSFSGIRPLPAHGDLAPGFVSRDYRIEAGVVAGMPLLSLVGGKWTTFRASAEHLASDALSVLRHRRRRSTQGIAIGGGRGFPMTPGARSRWVAAHRGGHDVEFAERLLDRYGTRATQLLKAIPAGEPELAHTPGYTPTELAWLAENEQAATLADMVLRRTSIAFRGGLTRAALREIAAAIAPVLGWTDRDCARETGATVEVLAVRHLVTVEG